MGEREQSGPRLRFAPSPNGRLHLGHAFSALTTWAWADACDGVALLRMEDIDTGRTRTDFIAGIFEDLNWLGLSWPTPVLHQSTRFDAYRSARARLEADGLLYPCAATRSEIADARPTHLGASDTGRDPFGAPLYVGRGAVLTERENQQRIAGGAPFALRLDMAAAIAVARRHGPWPLMIPTQASPIGEVVETPCDPTRWGDVVMVRKETPTSYHLAVVVDDAHQAVTHVTRGADIEPATDLHVLLQRLLGLPTPVYHHHPLITDETGRKLAKSAADTSLAALRAAGTTAVTVRHELGFPETSLA